MLIMTEGDAVLTMLKWPWLTGKGRQPSWAHHWATVRHLLYIYTQWTKQLYGLSWQTEHIHRIYNLCNSCAIVVCSLHGRTNKKVLYTKYVYNNLSVLFLSLPSQAPTKGKSQDASLLIPLYTIVQYCGAQDQYEVWLVVMALVPRAQVHLNCMQCHWLDQRGHFLIDFITGILIIGDFSSTYSCSCF